MRNTKKLRCKACTGIHDYITRLSDDTTCDTPVGFSYDKALKIAKLKAGGEADVVRVPDDTVIVLDDSARTLPHRNHNTLQLAQFTNVTQTM